MLALATAALILDGQSDLILAGNITSLAWFGVVLSVAGLVAMAIHFVCLGVASLAAGQFPAANVPVAFSQRVVTGRMGRISSVSMVPCGVMVGALALFEFFVFRPAPGVGHALVAADFRINAHPASRHLPIERILRTRISPIEEDLAVHFCKPGDQTGTCRATVVSMTYLKLPDRKWLMVSMSKEASR